MDTVQIAALLMLVPGGVWCGVIVCFAVERVPLWSRMPIEQYAVDFRRSLYRVDPMQPILTIITGIASIVFALSASGTAATFGWIAAGLLGVVLVSSISIGEPINSKFRRLPEGEVPPGAAKMRDAWQRFHLFRTFVAVGALIAMAAAVSSI